MTTAVTEAPVQLCRVCGWVYDPRAGAPEYGIAPGTPWEALPADWLCPECSVGKHEFEAVPL